MIPQEITDSLTSYFSGKSDQPFSIESAAALSGGCINQVYRIRTTHGDFCIKYNRSVAYPGMFESEARGLRLLRQANEIRVPEVICFASEKTYSYLLLEYIRPGSPVPDMMQVMGRELARLHRHTAEMFGEEENNYMGSLRQSNKKRPDWISFFSKERLQRQVILARAAGYLTPSTLDGFKNLCDRLGEIFPEEPPALLHGDLWGGNYMVDDTGKGCLIDPAVYYGHREIDIAMTTLFGGFSNDFYTAYQEEYPLEKGWQKRLDICNLYPLLIHLNLFGSGYLGQIEEIVRKF